MNQDFWSHADRLVREHEVVIDRPKGSRHPHHSDAIYPLDHGYLAGTKGGDGGGVDVWIGSASDRTVTGVIITVDVFKRDAEVKLLVGCTSSEAQLALGTHRTGSQGAILVPRPKRGERSNGREQTGSMDSHGLKFKAVLFDLDNTIADRVSAVRRLASELYEDEPAVQVKMTRDEAVAIFETVDRDGLVADKVKLFEELAVVWGPMSRSAEELATWLRSAYPRAYRPDPAAHELLGKLDSAGIPWGVVTNGPQFQVTKLEILGLLGAARCCLVSSVIGMRKPEAGIFQEALRQLGLSDPSQVLFVGDSPRADIGGAQGVGMKTAWVSRHRAWPEDLPRPDYAIGHVSHVWPILNAA